MFRPIRIRAGSAIFYTLNTPSMIVNNIPQSTVVQIAAFQFGDRPLWVESGHRLGDRHGNGSAGLFAASKEPRPSGRGFLEHL
jgi:hypothetical protein